MTIFSGVNDGVWSIRGTLVFLLCVGLATHVPANPSGRAVRAGEIRFQQSGDTLRVIQGSQHGIIDWDSFSIANGETTRFSQPNAQSATLNRVTGGSLSQIDGRLLANGRVFLLNSNGIVIGRDGVVDVAGFAASTLDVSNESFLAGGDLDFRGGSQAAVVNLGSISAFDGDIFLVAATVDNSGSLSAPRGTVGLAAGNDVLIRESGSERIFVRGASGGKKENGVINKGTVAANVAELKAYGGNVYGMAVKNEGRVAATGVTREGGQIFLRAGGGKVRSTGTLKAKSSNGSGGKVKVDSGTGGSTEIGGTIDASGGTGAGGEIAILGNTIEVFDGTLILNDGATMGGGTYIGGGLRGQDPEFANAETVTVGSGAMISANALGSGDGGQVVVFATDTATIHGTVSAIGGREGGNGGFIELSGQNQLFVADLVGQVKLSASRGASGTLLLDPIDVSVIDGVGGGIVGTIITDDAIVSALGAMNVVINTSGSGGSGDIVLANNANISWSSANNLSFLADRDFILNNGAVINSTVNGAFSATATRSISIGPNASITTTDGSLTLSANQQSTATSGSFTGIDVNGGLVQSTGTGNVTVSGRGGITGTTQKGVHVRGGGDIIGGTSGTVSVTGTGGTGSVNRIDGVNVEGAGATITSGGANVQVTGTGGASGVAFKNNIGVSALTGGVITAGGTGTVTVLGTGGSATGNGSHGVISEGAGSLITSNNGAVQITGFGGSGGASFVNTGVSAFNGGTISAGGATSPLTVTGTGGTGTGGTHHGVYAGFGSAKFTSGGGAVQITGTAGSGGSDNFGIFINDAGVSFTTATNGGSLTLIADSMSFLGAVSANSGSTVTLRQKTNGQLINLGAADSAGTLGLTDAELDRVTAGTLQIGNSNSGAITVSSAVTHGNHLSLTTGAGVTVNNAITMALNKSMTVTASAGTISLGASGALAATGTRTISLTGLDVTGSGNVSSVAGFTVTNTGTSSTLSGVISGAGPVTKSGAGTLIFTNSNTFSGGVNVQGGRLVALNNGAALSPGGTVAISSGATLELKNTTGSHFLMAAHTFTGAGTIQKTGADRIIFGGAGVVTVGLSAGGLIDVQAGELQGSGSFQGVWAGNLADLNVASGATFNGQEGNIEVNALTGSGTLQNGIFSGGSVTVGVAGGSGTFSGVIGDSFTSLIFIKTGTGTQILTGTNTYTGTTTISGGALQVGNGGTSGTLGTGAVTNNSALVFNRSNSLTIANAISGAGTLDVTAGGITVSGVWNLGGDATVNSTEGIDFRNTVTMSANKSLTAIATGTSTGSISLSMTNSDLSTSGTGAISLTAARNIILANNSSITTTVGNLTLSANAAGTTPGLFEGVYVGNGASVNSGTGTISITGRGGDTINAGNHGIRLDSTSTVASSGGNIFLTGQARGSAGANPTQEGLIVRGNITTTGSGNITLSGTGGNATSGNIGVHILDDVLVSTVNGNISITGVSGAGTNSPGIQVADFGSTPTVITSTGGTITLTGDGSAGNSVGINAFGNGVSIGGGPGAVALEAIGDLSFSDGAEIGATGTGTVSLTATRGVALGSGASVSSINGNLTISANQQIVPTTGNFTGVAINGATVQTTGSGVLSLSGRGGETGGSNFGINILNGGIVSGGTTGTTLLLGTGRGDTGTGNSGVEIIGSGSRVISSGSNVSITGTGGAGLQSRGVFLGSSSQVSTASAGGAITLTGIGTTGDNIGIEMNGGAITSSSGVVLLDGLGAGTGRAISSSAATDSLGSNSSHVILNSSGGDVNVQGVVSAPGLLLRDATAGGNVDFVLNNLLNDVNFLAANGTNTSLRIGSVDFSDADGFDVGTVGGVNGIAANGSVDLFSAGGGLETLRVSRAISSLGGPISVSGYNVTVSNSAITTSGIGTIDLTAARSLLVETDSAITVVNGDMTLKGNTSVAPLDGDFSGIVISDSTLTTSGQGGISLTGVAGGNASLSNSIVDGIRLIGGAVIQSTGTGTLAGGITLLGTGTSGNLPNAGVFLSGTGTGVSSVVGGISITGDGGDSVSGGGDGVVMGGGASIVSTGLSEVAAPITVVGTGGAFGSSNRGVVMQDANTRIEAVDGSISVTGTGGGQSTGESNRGIFISGASIQSTGSSGIELVGNGGLGFNRIDGVQIQNGASLTVKDGDLEIGGTAGGTLGHGVVANPTSGSISVSGSGSLFVTGSGVNAAGVNLSNTILGGANAYSILVESLAHDAIVHSTTSATGDITFKANRNVVAGGQITSGAGNVQFIGRDVTINSLVTASSGDVTVEVGRGITAPGSGGTAAVNADFVHGGDLSFVGGAGGEDAVTYAGYTGSGVIFDFDLLTGIENLIGTTFTTDQFNGPALAGSFLFTGSNVFDVNGVTVTGFENILGGAEDDLFSFNGGGSLSGALNGGGGTANEISYAGFTTGAVLNLEVGASSGIPGGFSNIQAFNGSPQIDTVIGLQAPSIYQFTGGLLNVGGFEVGGFDNLFAGPGNDTFIVGPGGGIPGLLSGGAGFDVLNYSGYGAPVSVNLGVPNATGFGGITALESYLGSAFEDSFTGSTGNDTFTINSINAGNINGVSLFASFEHLKGGPGTDRFLFLNQATVGSVGGGPGTDLLEIDDRTLGGTNTYTITNNRISRNPTYLFSGIEGIKLLLGPGNDTIVTSANGTVQTFDGGPGNDILDMGPGVFLTGSTMALGNSTIIQSDFEGPLPPITAPGDVLQVQTGNVPGPAQEIGFQVEDQFTPDTGPGMNGENVLQALSQAGGNAFSAVLAGQAVVLQIDGQQHLFGVPANLDGSLTPPPAAIIAQLRESLRADGWSELADAIGFEGPMTLVSIDGPYAVDLSSPIPPELLAVLNRGLLLDAAQELFDALEMVVFVPVTAADGAISIFAVAIPIDEATRAILLEQLSQAAFTELSGALEL